MGNDIPLFMLFMLTNTYLYGRVFVVFFAENLNVLTLLKITKVSTRAFFGRGVVKVHNL